MSKTTHALMNARLFPGSLDYIRGKQKNEEQI
jgi:hypothetical protein